MLRNILLINITHNFLLVTLTNIDKHVSIWILCEFEWRVIETRVYLRQLFHAKKKKMSKMRGVKVNKYLYCTELTFVKNNITSSSPPYCSSSAFLVSSFVTRSSSNLYLKCEYPTRKIHKAWHLQNISKNIVTGIMLWYA